MQSETTESGAVPSLKGMTFQPVVDRLRARLDAGKLSDEELITYLNADERELLEQRIAPTLWYPIATFERLMYFLREQEGGIDDSYFVQYGRETAAETLDQGPVQILLKGARAFGTRAGVALIKMSRLYFNFSTWEFVGESLERFEVRVRDCAPMPEVCRYTSMGFIEYLVREFTGEAIVVTSERAARDLILYHARPKS